MSKQQNNYEFKAVVDGAEVKTLSGTALPNSKPAIALVRISELEMERQQKRLAERIALILMAEHEIPRNSSSIAGRICGSVAKTNEKEVANWVLRETANIEEIQDLYEKELIQELSRKLWNILEEIRHGYC